MTFCNRIKTLVCVPFEAYILTHVQPEIKYENFPKKEINLTLVELFPASSTNLYSLYSSDFNGFTFCSFWGEYLDTCSTWNTVLKKSFPRPRDMGAHHAIVLEHEGLYTFEKYLLAYRYILSQFLGTSIVCLIVALFVCCMSYVHCVSCPEL